MKKIILMITLMLSFVVFIGEVEAAKELTCLYKVDERNLKYIKIIQSSDGSRHTYMYYNDNITPDIDILNDGWGNYSSDISDYQNESELDHCFEYYYKKELKKMSDLKGHEDEYKIKLSNTKENDDYKKLDKWKEGIPVGLELKIEDGVYNYDDEVSSGKWSASCIYKGKNSGGYVYLFFNKEQTLFVKEDGKAIHSCMDKFEFCEKTYEYFFYPTTSSLNLYYNNGNSKCPSSIVYIKDIYSKVGQGEEQKTYYYFTLNRDKPNNTGTRKDVYVYQNGNDDTANIYEDCKSLIGDEAIILINNIMKWVRIIVPILLIVFGMIDFSGAVFGSKEEDMKKARDRFIKRIVAAVIVFIVPIFINLILELANSAWSWIVPNNCIE